MIYHLVSQHAVVDSDGRGMSPDLRDRITPELIVDMHISRQEERLMNIDEQMNIANTQWDLMICKMR